MGEPEMKPQKVTDVELAFPARIEHLIPKWEDIPEQYRKGQSAWGHRLFTDLFFHGLKKLEFVRKEDIDPDEAFRHIRAILGSYAPKHEHKVAACAYLFELWFESATWEKAPEPEQK
jgi:hypothetical protein